MLKHIYLGHTLSTKPTYSVNSALTFNTAFASGCNNYKWEIRSKGRSDKRGLSKCKEIISKSKVEEFLIEDPLAAGLGSQTGSLNIQYTLGQNH